MLEAALRLIFVLGVLIFIHELGHFLLAKLVGIRVERFSLGFPPRMIGKKIGDTDYCLSWIPLGGYVKMAGMIDESLDDSSITGAPDEFMSKSAFQRFLVISAGPMMNILLAVALFAAVAYFVGVKEPVGLVVDEMRSEQVAQMTGLAAGDQIETINGKSVKDIGNFQEFAAEDAEITITAKRDTQLITQTFPAMWMDSLVFSLPPVVGGLIEGSPAQGAGLQSGDRIVSIENQPIKTWTQLTEIVHKHPQEPLSIVWERDGRQFSAEITPELKEQQGQKMGLIGISYPVKEKHFGVLQSVGHGFSYCWFITRLTYQYVKLVIKGEKSFKDAFGGPIMIAKMARDSAAQGESNFIIFLAFISLNLGLINLLPIPALDGGHLFFLLIEAIIRRPIPTKTKLVIQQVGMVILIAFMIFVIINDIGRLR
ncbi:MAG: RIP metalloprotease RseP [Calditrichaeota bacterium]|nr:RIP metalloprotease RseP [Calditrichota bacterium]